MAPIVSGVFIVIAALMVYVFSVRQSVDAWQCGNEPQDWARIARQLACMLLLVSMFGVFSYPVTTTIAIVAISSVTFSGVAYGLDDVSLNVACTLLALGAMGRQIMPIRETMDRVGQQLNPLHMKKTMQRYATNWTR